MDTYCIKKLNHHQITQTLNYYTKIGLIRPQKIEDSGFYYDEKTLAKLQYIIVLRYMQFSLQEIKARLEDKNFNLKESLKMQGELLKEESIKIHEIANSLIALSNQLDQPSEISYELIEKMFDYFQEGSLQKRRGWQIKYFTKMNMTEFNKNANKWQYYQSIMK